MTLQTHSKLGPYEILAPLGAGGMGEVYRARDTRLDRTVAIKVLPAAVAAQPDVRERFEREARAVAALNHPHICVLYDVGRHGGIDFIVMEYLEGETLESRLARGPLPLNDALRFASEIADALDKAHRRGITHRDLKPGNVMITKSGTKLLDFGLAKLQTPSGFSSNSAMPTNQALTAQGTIIGTLQYMSPEQLEGVEADARTDIFAFGALVYEMVTGKKAFEGKSQVSLMAAILEHQPSPIVSHQPMTPSSLDAVVSGCMAKSPDDRWQSMRDVHRQLEWIRVNLDDVITKGTGRNSRRERVSWLAVVAILLLAVAGLGWRMWSARDAASSSGRAMWSVMPPEDTEFDSQQISPDGRQLALVVKGKDGRTSLWIRPVDSVKATELSDTKNAVNPFWSPDNRFIGFFADGKLKKVDAEGRAVQSLADVGAGPRNGTWSRDGVIVFDYNNSSGLRRVSSNGGEVLALTVPDLSNKEVFHYDPTFLPDGRHFLYTTWGSDSRPHEIKVGSLDSKETRVLLPDGAVARYARPGYLLFTRSPSTLMAQAFDPDRLQLSGDLVALLPQVADYSVSENGLLVFRDAGALSKNEVVWLDRSGKTIRKLGPPGQYGNPAISPDGHRVAIARKDGTNVDIWVFDADRGTPTRLTFDRSQDDMPVWSPDGTEIAFNSNRTGQFGIYRKRASGEGDEQQILQDPTRALWPQDWSRDGAWFSYTTEGGPTGIDLWFLPMKGEPKPVEFLHSTFNEFGGQISSDGHFVAYTSDESGKYEVFVSAFASPSTHWQISTNEGGDARWRRDGKELFYTSYGSVMAVDIRIEGGVVKPGIPHELFNLNASHFDVFTSSLTGGLSFPYDVTADGQRFIFVKPVDNANPQPYTVLVNWTSALNRGQ